MCTCESGDQRTICRSSFSVQCGYQGADHLPPRRALTHSYPAPTSNEIVLRIWVKGDVTFVNCYFAEENWPVTSSLPSSASSGLTEPFTWPVQAVYVLRTQFSLLRHAGPAVSCTLHSSSSLRNRPALAALHKDHFSNYEAQWTETKGSGINPQNQETGLGIRFWTGQGICLPTDKSQVWAQSNHNHMKTETPSAVKWLNLYLIRAKMWPRATLALKEEDLGSVPSTHGSSQLPITPVPGDLMLSSDIRACRQKHSQPKINKSKQTNKQVYKW